MADTKNDYELLRQKNFQELEAFLSSSIDSCEFKEAVQSFNIPKNKITKKRKRKDDENFQFNGYITLEKRRSTRLSENTGSSYEEVFWPEKKKNKVQRRKPRISTNFEIVPVEDITDSYLKKVATHSNLKKYSQNGTSCHQCRQKTLDSKTYCRNSNCVGVRGQFCGPCLFNRYGEEATVVLKDPNWKCPPCRGLCNCSICRTREGKRPTGILAPIAFKYGHKSVKDFLLTLDGEGDHISESEDNLQNMFLLGYNDAGCPVMINNSQTN